MTELQKQTKHLVQSAIHGLLQASPALLGSLILGFLMLTLWAHWRIVKRAGYPGCWSLMMLVPILNVLFLLGFAFSKWPVEKRSR